MDLANLTNLAEPGPPLLMTQLQIVRWVIKPLFFLGALIPFGLLVLDTVVGDLGANPIEALTHRTGFWTITFLMVTLGVSPARRILRVNALIRMRRMAGLFAFFYGCLHFLIYGLDQSYFAGVGLSLALIVEDVAKRPYITVGFASFLLLVPLALTSTKGWVRRLGGKRWQRLHQVVYIAASGGVLHFLWLVKADLFRPTIFATVLVTLLGFRLVPRRGRGRKPATSAGASSPVDDRRERR